MKLTIRDYDGNEMACQGKWIICDRCNGDGVHDHPAFSNGISVEDFNEDPDFREQYMAGWYDVQCEECRGQGKILVPDLDNGGEAANNVQDFLEEKWKAEREMRAAYEAERRMGA